VRAATIVCAFWLSLASACTSTQTVRLQPEAVAVDPGMRPIAAIQANAISAYLLFIAMPGVDLDKVVNQMLIVTAKTMGADKVADLHFDITPDDGVWALRKLIGWRSAQASGIAVQVTGPAPDPHADDGPEPPGVGGAAPAPVPERDDADARP
jgi:hypothetical protein